MLEQQPMKDPTENQFFKNEDAGITFLIKSEQVVGSLLGKGSDYTVIGLYITVVIVFGRAIRDFFDKGS